MKARPDWLFSTKPIYERTGPVDRADFEEFFFFDGRCFGWRRDTLCSYLSGADQPSYLNSGAIQGIAIEII